MKKRKKLLMKRVSKLAVAVTAANVNSTCLFYMNQPELPQSAEKLKKKSV
jgi:cyclic lactone autoinducer peptide